MNANKITFDELQGSDEHRLKELELEMRETLLKARMHVFEDKAKLAAANKLCRKKIAQILTIKRQRQLSKASK